MTEQLNLYQCSYRSRNWIGIILKEGVPKNGRSKGNYSVYALPLFTRDGRRILVRQTRWIHQCYMKKIGRTVNIKDINPDWLSVE